MAPVAGTPIFVVLYVVNICSIIGTGLLLLEWYRRPPLRKRTLLRPIAYDAFFSLIWAIDLAITFTPLVSGYGPIRGLSCSILGAINQFVAVSSFGWYTCIAINSILIFRAPVERPAFSREEQRGAILHLEERAVLILSLLSVVPPLFGNYYGPVYKKANNNYEMTGRYECWIRNEFAAPAIIGQTLNFLAFIAAALSGILLLVIVFRNRRRIAVSSGVIRQTARFVAIFTIVWTFQHIYDFASLAATVRGGVDYDDDPTDDDDGKRGLGQMSKFFECCNVALKGAAGLVTFISWYWTRALSTSADEKGAGTAGDPESHSMDEYLRLSDYEDEAT